MKDHWSEKHIKYCMALYVRDKGLGILLEGDEAILRHVLCVAMNRAFVEGETAAINHITRALQPPKVTWPTEL